jgi:Toprim-like
LKHSAYESERGFDEGTFNKYQIRVEGEIVYIPTLGRHGAWYEREHRPQGNPKYKSPTGVESHLYNPAGIGPNSREVWFAEGEFDTITLLMVGAPAVGILGTQAFKVGWRHLFDKANIVLALDSDQAGEETCVKLAQLWTAEQVTRFNPKPYGDVNEWYKEDRAGFRRAVLEWET